MDPPLASWMTPVDRDILALMHNGDSEELALTPKVVAANLDWKSQTVREHLPRLADHGLVEYADEDRALYRITDRGRRYIEGDIDPEKL